ncbi:MAG: hypothetical protein ACXU84_06840, partial [Xanthobacteraceae bacterium]
HFRLGDTHEVSSGVAIGMVVAVATGTARADIADWNQTAIEVRVAGNRCSAMLAALAFRGLWRRYHR